MTQMITIGKSGRLVIPILFRKMLDLDEGDGIVLSMKDGHLELAPVATNIKKAQDQVKKYMKYNNDLVDLLFKDRKEDNSNEH